MMPSEQPTAPDPAPGSIFDQRSQQIYTQTNIASLTLQPPAPRIPLQRLARAEHFVDRTTALAQLLTALQPGQVVTLCGPGGIGKTALATEALWQLPSERFPDGILSYSFYGRGQIDLACEHIARSFGEDPKPTPRTAAQRALAGRRALLLLDGAEEADDLPALLALRAECGVLVTSRRRQDALTARQDVEPLPLADAITLLQAWGGSRAADMPMVSQIAELVGRLPLALRLVGRYLAQTDEDASDYLTWLTATPLAALDQGQRREESVPLLLARSLAQVTGAARAVLEVVGCLAFAPFEHTAVAVAQNISERTARQALGELVNYGLLVRPDAGYEVTHALVHTYAHEQLQSASEVFARLAAYYTARITAQAADFGIRNQVRPHIIALLHGCKARQLWSPINTLVHAIDSYLDLQGHWADRLAALTIAVNAAQTQQDQYAQTTWLRKLGLTYENLGEVEQAIIFFQQALAIAQSIDDNRSEESALGNLGTAYFELGQIEKAIMHHQQALVIAKAIGDQRGEGKRSTNLGLAYYVLGQVEKAINYFTQALTISRFLNDRSDENRILGNLGLACYGMGQLEQAITYTQQALSIAQSIGDRYGEANWLGNLGLIHMDLGQVDLALAEHKQALTIAHAISHRRGEANELGNLGLVYYDLEQLEVAVDYYQQALAITQAIKDERGEAIHLHNLGRTQADRGNRSEAIRLCEEALIITKKTGIRPDEGEAFCNLGYIYFVAGDLSHALNLYQQGIAILKETHYRQPLARALLGLGQTCFALDQAAQAQAYWQEALTLAHTIGQRRTEGEVLAQLGRIAHTQDRHDVARQYWQAALAILTELKAPTAERVRQWLAQA